METISIHSIMRENEKVGQVWFSLETMRFFGSRLDRRLLYRSGMRAAVF